MKLKIPQAARCRSLTKWLTTGIAATVAAVMVAAVPTPAEAIATPVPLGTAASFSVLAGSEVTNTGPSLLSQDLGVSPGTAISGFPPGQVLGAVHAADQVANDAKSDLVTAYNNAASQATDFALAAGIGAGQTLLPGVYTASSGVGLTGDLILDAGGNPNAVWVFQIPEALTTASSSRVLLTNGASACNVYWQIGSSATLGTNSTFVGTLMALTSISVTTGTNIEGRALARNGAVTLDNNRIFPGNCSTTTTGTTTGTTVGTTTGTTVGLIGGGLVGGPLVTGGGTVGSTSGTTSGNTAGNTAGNNVTAGSTAGGHNGKPGEPGHGDDHGGKPGGGHGDGHGGKPGEPGHEDDHGGKPGGGHGKGHDEAGKPSKPDHGHGMGPDELPGNYGFGDAPKTEEHEDAKG